MTNPEKEKPNASFENPLMPNYAVPSVFKLLLNAAFRKTQRSCPNTDLSGLNGFKESFVTRKVKNPDTGQQPVLGLWPKLRAYKFWDTAETTLLADIERDLAAAFVEIKEEILKAQEKGVQPKSIAGFPTKKPDDWTNLVLGMPSKASKRNKENFPITLQTLAKHEKRLAVRGIEILKLDAGVELPPHTDGSNATIALQMGIDVPGDCWLRIYDEERELEEGKVVFFDQSFPHNARNNSQRERLVLFAQLYHPDISDNEITAIDMFSKTVTRYAIALFPVSLYYLVKVMKVQKKQEIFSETEENNFVKCVDPAEYSA